MRERFQNMSEEERAKFREQMRSRGGSGRGGFIGRQDQEKAIKAIEEALVKVKAAAQVQMPQGGFQDMSEEERNTLRTAFTDRSTALNAIIAQVAALQGRRQPAAEGARYLIINVGDLKPIQAAAVKEKAKETAKLLQSLIARGSGRRGFGGGRPPGAGQRPQGGQRGPRGTRAPGDREGAGRQRNR